MNLDLTSFAIFSLSLFQPRYRSATSFISLLSVFPFSSKNAFRDVDAVAIFFLSVMFPLNSGPSCFLLCSRSSRFRGLVFTTVVRIHTQGLLLYWTHSPILSLPPPLSRHRSVSA